MYGSSLILVHSLFVPRCQMPEMLMWLAKKIYNFDKHSCYNNSKRAQTNREYFQKVFEKYVSRTNFHSLYIIYVHYTFELINRMLYILYCEKLINCKNMWYLAIIKLARFQMERKLKIHYKIPITKHAIRSRTCLIRDFPTYLFTTSRFKFW